MDLFPAFPAVHGVEVGGLDMLEPLAGAPEHLPFQARIHGEHHIVYAFRHRPYIRGRGLRNGGMEKRGGRETQPQAVRLPEY